MDLWKTIEDSNAGEPGFMFTNNADYGTNPCAEISLLHNCFCNLTEINFSTVQDQEDFNYRCEVATFFGTLQAGFTDFHYLRPVWRRQAEKEALLGVSLTGQATDFIDKIDLKQGAEVCNKINEVYAEAIGINKAARIGTTKPSGTASLVLGCSSGIHAWHDKYYIRRMQIIKSEDLYKYLHSINPDIVPDYEAIPNTAVLEIPVKAPEGAITRDSENAIQLLERVKRIHQEWIHPSHRKGDNTHNVSATISIDKSRMYPRSVKMSDYEKVDEWVKVGEWMWENRNEYTALSVLPYDGGTYRQAPFESITEDKYNQLMSKFPTNIDLTQIVEIEDTTKVQDEVACGADGCEIV
jgi:ribonucleoside-diphosphate reductase alpha chain